MFNVRAAALCAVLGFSLFAVGCSGGGGATPPVDTSTVNQNAIDPITQTNQTTQTTQPAQDVSGSTLQTMSTTTTTEDSTITASLKHIKVSGSIVALKTGGFQIQGGSGVGYVWITPTSSTKLFYGGLKPAVGHYATVVISGTLTSFTPVLIALSSSAPGTVTTSGTVMSEQPYGVAVKLDSTGAYIPLAFNSASNLYGLIGTGVHVSVTGVGSTATAIFPSSVKNTSTTSGSSTPAPSGTPAPTTSTSVPKHVKTAGLIYGYSGTPTTVPLSTIAPWLTWGETSEQYAPTLRAAGIKVALYMNYWRNYSTDNPVNGYNDLKPGGAHAAAEAKNCSGTPIYDSAYGGGYEANAQLTTYATEHAKVVASYREQEYGSNYDALLADDTGALGGVYPCGYSQSAFISGSNAVASALAKPMFVNTLNAGPTQTGQVPYTGASNILGGMCESCYAYWTTVSGVYKDLPRYGSTWVNTEDAQAQMAANHKIFWEYARAIGSAASEIGLRNYVYASFLLTFDPNYSMLEEAFKTPSGFEVFPEAGLVPTNPVTTYTNVAYYQRSGGAYMREFGACYYRGVYKGKCAVVVNNSNTTSVTVPTTAYSHAMVLSGYGVADGGTVSFSGSRPSSLGPTSGVVLFP